MIEVTPRGGRIRRQGRLEVVRERWKTRRVDFGDGEVTAINVPWGDVTTAYHSTGIPNIEVYLVLGARARFAVRVLQSLSPLARNSLVQRFLKSLVRRRKPGPSAEERRSGRCRLWGEVRDEDGSRVVSRLDTPEGYTFTAEAAVAVVERVLNGEAPLGFQTPAMTFGPDLVLGLDGVQRWDDALQ